MLNILINSLDYYIKACRNASDRATKRTFFDQAFGACQYHIMMFHNDQQKVEALWNVKYKPEFEELCYGGE